MNYILTMLITLFSVYAQANAVTDKDNIRKWFKSNPFKKWGTWVTITLCALSCYCLWKSEHDARQQHDNDVIRSEELRRSLNSVSNNLTRANAKIDMQESTIADQTRTIGSIAYNTQTTLEGKQRFIRCFRDLTRLTKLNREGMVFEGLICGDGVAMYWFKQDTEQMLGFHFFSNSELNRVLSGIPSDTLLFSENGTLNINPKSELAIALNESLYGRTPSHKDNPIDQNRAIDAIIDEVKILLEYVFRARDIKICPVYGKNDTTTPLCPPTVGIELSFEYVVKPAATKPYTRFVKGVELSSDDLNSLQGIDKVTFSKRVINHWRAQKIEPKVKIRDIRCLNLKHLKAARQLNSPFEEPDTEDR